MKQITAKTVEDVLEWVETNQHHRGEWIGPYDAETHFILTGHQARIRIPTELQKQTRGLIEPSKAFDTRMFRATKSGRARLARYKRSAQRRGEWFATAVEVCL